MTPGSRLGPYEITAKLGEGGMGEVWRATDTRLKREVAIKVLPAAFTADKERLARFEREAQLLAQLHHPHIASIFGLEESDGVRALVMELVEGPTLAERMADGPVPLDEALAIARQIAEALEDAHEHGIIHRDLKPQNVKVRADGTVKVLDFGLAKAMEPGGASSAADLARSPTLMNSPTLTVAPGTQLGVILGTAAYMAPEQARGGATDKRADIWAFGVVLYEMLAGRSLFAGETVSDTLAGVLKTEIDFARLPQATPAAVRRLLRWCLERNPRNRLHDIADARLLLAEAAERESPAQPAARSRVARWVPWLLAAAGLGLGAAGLRVAKRGPRVAAASAPITRVRLLPAATGKIDGFPSLSPDGRTLVFEIFGEDGVGRLQSYSFDTGDSRPLPGTEHGEQPFWSPDGRWLGFFAGGRLAKLELATGLTQPLAAASDPRGGCWSESGDIVYTPNSSSGLFRVPAAGGKAERVTQVDPKKGEQSHRLPLCLPGARAIVYTVLASAQGSGLVWRSLGDGTEHRLAPEISRTAFDARGYLLWVRQSALVAQAFDPARGELRGDPAAVSPQVGFDGQRAGFAWFDAAGGVVVTRSGLEKTTELRWFDRAGQPLEAVTSPGTYTEPALSPDGTRVAVTVSQRMSPLGNIWVFATDAKDRGSRVTFDDRSGSSTAVWLEGGRSLAFSFSEGDAYGIGRRAADGTGSTETLWKGSNQAFIDDATARGPLAVMEIFDQDGGFDLWLLPLAGDRRARRFGDGSQASRAHGAFSPDGRLLAYASDESGLSQVYVAEVDAPSNRWQVTTDGGDLPQWRPDGKELYWEGADRMLHAAAVQSLAPFAVGPATSLFRLRVPKPSLTGNHSFYAPARDGQRFLVRAWIGEESEPGMTVTMNWQPRPGGDAPR
jgi:Tol biopolymer transport system component